MKKGVCLLVCIKLLILCQFPDQLNAQMLAGPEKGVLTLPVDIPIFLAGNFGEPRPNHFHSGIDIKTNGATGVPVKSVADGYVSRIKIEAGGYGNALYIRHPNGFTSLYGHLQSFNEQIRQYIIAEQYRRESFAVDLFPDPARLVVKQGQLVALSGNSGSSEGPHLHFELRETQSENPVNPLLRSISLKDVLPPVIEKIHIYSLKGRSDWVKPVHVAMIRSGALFVPAKAETIPLDSISGIGIETYDLLNGSDNHCGVYRIRGYIDDNLFFESRLDEISFAETRYVNSFMDYKYYMSGHKAILKLFLDPNNHATFYRIARDRGQLDIKDGNDHKFRIVVDDAAGNESAAEFTGHLDPARFPHNPDFVPEYNAYFSFQDTNTFRTDDVEVVMPPGALYDNLYFEYSVTGRTQGSFSQLHHVHHADVPVHQYYRLAIEAVNIPDNLKSKAVVAQYLGSKSYSCLGGTWEGNRLVTRIRNFGNFCIMTDTIRPVVKPVNFTTAAELKSLSVFRFAATDDFSGIQTYRGEIDGKWILLEYDAKSSTLQYAWDSGRIKTGMQHKMVIRVADQLGNSGSYTISFFR